jgi:phosphoribosyl 1,2-cyclic phosphodiesterase
MNIFVLASGSKGNMTLIQSQNAWLCMDVGISIKKIEEKLLEIPFLKGSKMDVLITHEHGDHIQGLKAMILKGYVDKVYMNENTFKSLKEDVATSVKDHLVVFKESSFNVGDFYVTPFVVSHDAVEPVGFSVVVENKKIVLITDTGYLDEVHDHVISLADVYLIEANHQPDKLLSSLRPMLLKRRILGEKGHLSNEDASRIINRVMKDDITHWIVMHISEDCNSILDIEKAVVKYIKNPLHMVMHYTNQMETIQVSL